METIVRKKLFRQLKDLIVVNNDRFEGYKTAANKTQDTELKALFNNYSLQSKQFSNDLLGLLPEEKYPRKPNERKSSGKLFRAYMGVKSYLYDKNPGRILYSCEFGEKEAKRTYEEVLHNSKGIRNEALSVIRQQWIELQKAHFKIRIMQYKLFIG
jgi:uncharacterized protein (TIGR02284 family)